MAERGALNVSNIRGNSPNFRVAIDEGHQLDMDSDLLFASTADNAIQLPTGTEAQRSSSFDTIDCAIRINTDTGGLEVFRLTRARAANGATTEGKWYEYDAYEDPDEGTVSSGPTTDLGTFSNPATSASALKTALATNAVNDAYWYVFDDGTKRMLWTDFETYPRYAFVMVTRIYSGSQEQYQTGGLNTDDLRIPPNNSPATRVSKLEDTYMQEIATDNGPNQTVRWALVGNGSSFYRLDNNPLFYSNHGQSQTCSYSHGMYSAYASPNNNPIWDTTFRSDRESCGGVQDDGAWMSLTGIHTNDGTYYGGYSGSNSSRVSPPSPYGGLGGSNDQWSMNGWVLMSW